MPLHIILLASEKRHLLDAARSNLQDALERAYQQDITRQTEDAKKSYQFAINAIYEGLAVQVPSSWLPGTNVNKLRCNLNSWLQLAVDRYKHWQYCFLPLMPSASGRPRYSSNCFVAPMHTIRLLLGSDCINCAVRHLVHEQRYSDRHAKLQLAALCHCVHGRVSIDLCQGHFWDSAAFWYSRLLQHLSDQNVLTGYGILSHRSQALLPHPSPRQQTAHSAATSAAISLRGRPNH